MAIRLTIPNVVLEEVEEQAKNGLWKKKIVERLVIC